MARSGLIGVFAALTALTALAGGCSSSPAAAPGPVRAGNGVNDVKSACELRVSWSQATVRDCSNCVFVAPAEACECDPTPERGRCFPQQSAYAKEPDCTLAITSCLNACKPEDCACLDGCYAGHAACRSAASAVAGCVAEVCSPGCR